MPLFDSKLKDLPSISRQIETHGWVVIKSFFSREEITAYRQACLKSVCEGPWAQGKFFKENVTPDYATPWILDDNGEKLASFRLYQFLHNRHNTNTQSIFDRVLSLRDQLETPWPETAEFYRETSARDYIIVSGYLSTTGFYPRHRDAPKEIKTPLLQSEIYLSDPDIDFEGGELVLVDFHGTEIRIGEVAEFGVGDLLFFDKRAEHWVEGITESKISSTGRWMALIGAKTKERPEEFPGHDPKFDFLRKSIRRYGLQGSGEILSPEGAMDSPRKSIWEKLKIAFR